MPSIEVTVPRQDPTGWTLNELEISTQQLEKTSLQAIAEMQYTIDRTKRVIDDTRRVLESNNF